MAIMVGITYLGGLASVREQSDVGQRKGISQKTTSYRLLGRKAVKIVVFLCKSSFCIDLKSWTSVATRTGMLKFSSPSSES